MGVCEVGPRPVPDSGKPCTVEGGCPQLCQLIVPGGKNLGGDAELRGRVGRQIDQTPSLGPILERPARTETATPPHCSVRGACGRPQHTRQWPVWTPKDAATKG